DVVGTGIFRDKLTTASDLEVRGNLILKGNLVGKYGTAVLQGNTTIQGGPLKIDSLEVGSRLGNRIALYGGMGNTPKYGFGIQSGLLQMFSDAPNTNIAFGYGNSYAFTERARIMNQGEFGMSLTGRLQLRTGTQSAGHWLTNMANSSNVAFIGLASDNLVGFYGPGGAQWGLVMNTLNANVGIGLNGTPPAKPLSFPASLGEKILLYPGGTGEVGIGVYGNELRIHADNAGAKVSFGTQTNAGVYSENALAQRNGAFAFSILGNLWVNGSTYTSDERFKKNITPIDSALKRLMLIRGVEYEMKTEEFAKMHFTKGRQMGLLAQNVEMVVPEAVQEKDGYKGVDYARLVPLLIESIKELKQEIEQLKNRLNNQQ
ncbi:MAG: tail fiber domain-containing protein, partial [Chitinophagaceae bacterium]